MLLYIVRIIYFSQLESRDLQLHNFTHAYWGRRSRYTAEVLPSTYCKSIYLTTLATHWPMISAKPLHAIYTSPKAQAQHVQKSVSSVSSVDKRFVTIRVLRGQQRKHPGGAQAQQVHLCAFCVLCVRQNSHSAREKSVPSVGEKQAPRAWTKWLKICHKSQNYLVKAIII